MAAPAQKQVADVVDEYLELPEGKGHLCSAQDDNDQLLESQLRFLLNSEVLEIYREVIDALEISRGLPEQDHVANIQISDPLVLMMLAEDQELRPLSEDEARLVARQKASGYYQKQKSQVASDAMFIAMTFYNEINMVPVPYKEGEIAFSTSDDRPRARKMPDWVQTKAGKPFEFPLPERRLSNPYEMRLKLLYQLTQECGMNWTLGFRRMFEIGLTKTLRLSEARDDAGFQPRSTRGAVPKKSGAKGKKGLDQAGSE